MVHRLQTVTLTDFKIEASQTEFVTGARYRFVVTNRGGVNHEFMITPPMMGGMSMEKMHEMALLFTVPAYVRGGARMFEPAARSTQIKSSRNGARARIFPSGRKSRPRHVRTFSKRELAEFRMRLEKEQARLRAELRALSGWAGAAEERAVQAVGDESEDLEAITGHSERERENALESSVNVLVEEIRSALERIACGCYGLCARCGRRIPDARLRALPYATMCVRCKQLEEQREGKLQLADHPATVRILSDGMA